MSQRKSEIIVEKKGRKRSTFKFKDWNGMTYLELDTDDPQFKECWALHNLQPMWKKDNRSKGNRRYQLSLPLWK